ncbi:glutamine synthetase nodule isozyme-like [Melitaea cinxia]|uniref:glutamine synthetase nodule isozyme-like n=1 Tax=Melitaea cinxia TaxID=113334 RepID=UPI001E27001E|nr:glutamine synthetase nodule isozyme-like [Melitaea cinxia]
MSIAKFVLGNRKILKAFSVIRTQLRNIAHEHFTSGVSKLKSPLDAYYSHFINLPLPRDKVFATYIWIDGTGINLRSKDRIIDKVPCDLQMVPKWSYDGSSTGQAKIKDSDTILVPCGIYRDPFRSSPHILVLCETFHGDGTPTATNHRVHCAKLLSEMSEQEPLFGIEQEYTIFDSDLWPLGWPKCRGFPVVKTKLSYCGNGEHVAGREIVECHARACVYSGMDYKGNNAEVMKGSWEFQVGTTLGIKAADDLWIGRYLLVRIAEIFGNIISYHPKPMGKDQPGIGCHHNFSTKKMRENGGITEIERICKVLCDKHDTYVKNYGLGDGDENRKRLTGKHETAPFDTCKWAVADRGASIRIQKSVKSKGKGFLEDRRPAGDCDPYRVCKLLAQSCL